LQKNVIFLFQNIIIFRERLKCVIVFYGIEELFYAKFIFYSRKKILLLEKYFPKARNTIFMLLEHLSLML